EEPSIVLYYQVGPCRLPWQPIVATMIDIDDAGSPGGGFDGCAGTPRGGVSGGGGGGSRARRAAGVAPQGLRYRGLRHRLRQAGRDPGAPRANGFGGKKLRRGQN